MPFLDKELKIKQSTDAAAKLRQFPTAVVPHITSIRNLILETATQNPRISQIDESLKWGELSYAVKKGSPIRIGWHAKSPERIGLYFICTTSLVETFRHLYGDTFTYEKNRAILFDFSDEIPEPELKDCIGLAMDYHLLKGEVLLGR